MKRALPDLARAADLILSRGGTLGRPLHLLLETTSTNDEAKRAAKEGAPHGATWVAESQRAGRGRQGRVWISPPGENLLFSVLLRLRCAPSRLPPLALVAGLAVRDAIESALRGPSSLVPSNKVLLKWPNDVLVGGKKIAGVLVEAAVAGHAVESVVIGIGLNVHTLDFPDDLAGIATSLALLGSPVRDRAELLADTLHALDRDVHLAADRGLGLIHARLSEHDALRGKRVRGGADETCEGTAEGIDLDGMLLVRRDDGVRVRWSAGEVHLV